MQKILGDERRPCVLGTCTPVEGRHLVDYKLTACTGKVLPKETQNAIQRLTVFGVVGVVVGDGAKRCHVVAASVKSELRVIVICYAPHHTYQNVCVRNVGGMGELEDHHHRVHDVGPVTSDREQGAASMGAEVKIFHLGAVVTCLRALLLGEQVVGIRGAAQIALAPRKFITMDL